MSLNITFKETPEQRELVRAMADSNKHIAEAAQVAFAQLLAPTLAYIYQQADTTKFLYQDFSYEKGTDPSFPIELYSDVSDGYFSLWTSQMPGGIPSNIISQPVQEVKFQTYNIQSAWSILAKYAKAMRLPIVAKTLERLLQEVLLKTNIQAWNVFLSALANASHKIGTSASATPIGHVYRSANAGVFSLDEYNKLMTLFRRLNAAWNGGTPVGGGGSPTDFVVSPEAMEKFRAMSYNPINTTGPNGVAITANSQQASAGVVPLTDEQRQEIYKTAGYPSFFGVNIMQLNELGKNQSYQTLFANYSTAGLPTLGNVSNIGGAFNASTDELIIVVDNTKTLGLRAIATDTDLNSTFTLQPDDQFPARSGKIGWYGGIEEGRITVESRGMAAVVV